MNFFRRLTAWLDSRRRADELADEMEAHRAFVDDELRRSGLSPADAAAESRRRLGNVTLAREESRDVWALRWLDQCRQYLRYGARGLKREPLFALTAILTLGLGTAATTTVLSVINSELGPLPYSNPRELVEVRSRPGARDDTDAISLSELLDWRRAPGLASLASSSEGRRVTLQLDHAESLVVTDITANYFTTLGRPAVLGRVFGGADAYGASTAVLTTRGWTRAFERDPGVIGRVVPVDGQPTTIIGVVADDEALGFSPDIFLPMDERPNSGRTLAVYGAVGRLAAGATPDIVRAQVGAIVAQRTATDRDVRGHLIAVEDLGSYYSPLDNRRLYFFLGASLLVLLLTIVNTAGLVLSRVLRRTAEFALRGALGGGVQAIATQLVLEAALVVVPACLVGLWLTSQVLGSLGALVPGDYLGRGSHISLDWPVIAGCAGIAIVTVAGLAVVPLRLARRVGSSAIGAGARTSGQPGAGRIRTVLLTAQLAVTMVLLATAGLFLESFVGLLHVPLGFEPASAWSARLALSGPRYADESQRRAYTDALLDQARAIPGVRSAAIATSSPLTSGWLAHVRDARRADSTGGGGDTEAIYRAVGGDYFATIGTPIVRGRALLPTDTNSAPAAAVVNEQFAQTVFPDEDPVGKVVFVSTSHAPISGGTITIVGVAANIKEISPHEVAFEDMYVPFAQHPAPVIELLVRGAGNASMTRGLRDAAAAVDPTIPVTSTTTLADRVTKSLKGARFNLTLVAGFAIAALLIAAIGIYGAMAYAAAARWREYGVRLALGATPGALVGRALWQAARLGIAGGLVGIAGVLMLARWIGDGLYLVAHKHSGLLYGVTTTDPLALASALVGVVALALLAGVIPARRVSKIDPVRALRAE